MNAQAEVFQVSLSVERQWIKEVMRGVLGAILFQRVVGNIHPRSVEPAPADSVLEETINSHVDQFSRALDQSSSYVGGPKPSRLYLSLYPTPRAPTALPPSKPRPSVTSTLGWFSASTKALVGGGSGSDDRDTQADDEEDYGTVWEGWLVEVEIMSDRRGPAGSGEEKLRGQLNEFLLRLIAFSSEKTSHIPPITSADVAPFGIQISINPDTPPFPVPKPVVQAPAFPLLHKQLVKPVRSSQGTLEYR